MSILPILNILTYRKNYGSQNIITKLIEECRKNLESNFVVGTVLTDLSDDFDCILHDLLITKLSAYNFSDEALSYIHSYLTNHWQCVCINSMHCELKTIISGVSQGSTLGLILLNLLINWVKVFKNRLSKICGRQPLKILSDMVCFQIF